MMCSKVFLSEALEYTLTTNWAAGYRNHDVAQNSLDQDRDGERRSTGGNRGS
jgi:hypothetical protein